MDFNAMQEMQSKRERLGKAMIDAANKASFSLEAVRTGWFFQAVELLKYASPLTTGLTPEDFTHIAAISKDTGDIPSITHFQFGALCNNIEARTPNEINNTLAEYAKLLNETAGYAKKWRERDAEIMKKVQADFEADETAKRKALSGKELMKPVTGQA